MWGFIVMELYSYIFAYVLSCGVVDVCSCVFVDVYSGGVVDSYIYIVVGLWSCGDMMLLSC